MDPHQTDAGFFVSDAVVRAPAEAVNGEKKMKEERQGDRSRVARQTTSDGMNHKIGLTCFMGSRTPPRASVNDKATTHPARRSLLAVRTDSEVVVPRREQ